MIVYDLFCGLGGWAEGFLAEGWRVIGYDIEAHDYGTGGYPGELRLRDVSTIDGAELADADCIVASPPCQAYSYRAMPWFRAKALPPPDNTLFEACFRIQRQASAAAGRYIPLIVENVRGAQKWVGRAKFHYGSYYLWGDIPALMPITMSRKTAVGSWDVTRKNYNPDHAWTPEETKNNGGSWFGQRDGKPLARNDPRDMRRDAGGEYVNACAVGGWNHPDKTLDGVKGFTPNGERLGKNTLGRKHGSRSKARKRASAEIAKIPLPLAQWIARVMKPGTTLAN